MHVQYYVFSCLVLCLVITLDQTIDWTLFPLTHTSYLVQFCLCLLITLLSLSFFFCPLKGEQNIGNSPSSDILENLYLADPETSIQFQVGLYYYQLSFKGTHFEGSYLQMNCFTKIDLQAISAFQIYDLLYQCYQIYLVGVR